MCIYVCDPYHSFRHSPWVVAHSTTKVHAFFLQCKLYPTGRVCVCLYLNYEFTRAAHILIRGRAENHIASVTVLESLHF